MSKTQKVKIEELIANPPRIRQCRVCGNEALVECLNLGHQYLSSIFPDNLDYRATFPKHPMELVLCEKAKGESHCGLLQLGHRLDLSSMYEAYPYTSGNIPRKPQRIMKMIKHGNAEHQFRLLRRRFLIYFSAKKGANKSKIL